MNMANASKMSPNEVENTTKSSLISRIASYPHRLVSIYRRLRLRLLHIQKNKFNKKHLDLIERRPSEISKRIKNLEAKMRTSCYKIKVKYSNKAKNAIENEYEAKKNNIYSKSNSLKGDRDSVEANLDNARRAHNSLVEKHASLVTDINYLSAHTDYTLPSSEYDRLCQQRYVLNGKLMNGGLPQSQYYALKNKVAQLDDRIDRAKNSQLTKSRLADSKEMLQGIKGDMPSAKQLLDRLSEDYDTHTVNYNNQLREDASRWEAIKDGIRASIVERITEEHSEIAEAEIKESSMAFDKLIGDVPIKFEADIERIKNKLENVTKKIELFEKSLKDA